MSSLRNRIATVAVAGALASAGVFALSGYAAASTPQCGNSSVRETNAPQEGATGHGSAVLLFQNVSSATCTLYGYPGLDADTSAGHVLAHASRTLKGFAGGPGVEKTITLGFGQYASAVVEWLNFNPTTSGDCTFSTEVKSTTPNTTHTVTLPIKASVCDLQIHPVQAGNDGLGPFALAQSIWIAGNGANAATQGEFWTKTEVDLKKAGSEYATQISELTSLIALPNTGLTPAQIAQVHKLVSELDAFLQTPGLYT
jgi:hypothetical protein